MEDMLIPNYHERVARGEVFVNPMTAVEWKRSASGSTGGYSFTHILNSISYTNGFAILRPAPTGLGKIAHLDIPIDIGALRILAGTQAASNVAEPEFYGQVFLAELRETIGFLRNPIKGMTDLAKRYRRAGRRAKRRGTTRAYSVLQFIEEEWLAYRYAVMPIVFDMQDAVNAVDSLKEKPERFTARGSAKDEGSNSLVVGPVQWGPFAMSKVVTTRRAVSVRAGILYTMNTRDTFGLSPSQIPSTVWELVPFSFVVDWFVNVGDYIGAITPKIGVDILGSWTTVRDEALSFGSGFSTWNPPSGNYVNQGTPTSSESWQTRETQRSAGHAIDFAVRPIPFSGDLGTKRIVDGIALLDGILRSKL
jgi:hypothetical protein